MFSRDLIPPEMTSHLLSDSMIPTAYPSFRTVALLDRRMQTDPPPLVNAGISTSEPRTYLKRMVHLIKYEFTLVPDALTRIVFTFQMVMVHPSRRGLLTNGGSSNSQARFANSFAHSNEPSNMMHNGANGFAQNGFSRPFDNYRAQRPTGPPNNLQVRLEGF